MCRECNIDFSYYNVYEDGMIWSKHWNRKIVGWLTPDGYVRVTLKCLGNSSDTFMLNRVIYFYFKGDIPDGMKVNHIDENKENNAISNLNLLTHIDNCNWGTRNERISKALTGRKNGPPSEEKRKNMSKAQKERMAKEEEKEKYYKPIWQYTEDYKFVMQYKSGKEASEKTGFAKGAISSASRGCLNRQGNHKLGGYLFFNEAQF